MTKKPTSHQKDMQRIRQDSFEIEIGLAAASIGGVSFATRSPMHRKRTSTARVHDANAQPASSSRSPREVE